MKIALIGGSGFIGTRLIEILRNESSCNLKNIDLQPSYFYNDITIIGDVRDVDQMDQLLCGVDLVILLAAVHRDDTSNIQEYFDTNVGGMRNTLTAMDRNGVKRLVFYSSVAVYGLNKENPAENHPADPFNAYGKSKWEAELVLQDWYKSHRDWDINIIRPTVVFGERNRGNVYNLLKQISGGRFLMVGSGSNRKSMAYVGYIVAFTKYLIEKSDFGYKVYNYVDKPDFCMNDLVSHIETVLNKKIPSMHIPYAIGMAGGYCFDFIAWVSRKKLSVSSVRVKKFCATTEFDSSKLLNSGFLPPYTLKEGLARTLIFEFLDHKNVDITFETE